MNLNTTMKKLQRAIISTGLIIKIGTSQFYSPDIVNAYTAKRAEWLEDEGL